MGGHEFSGRGWIMGSVGREFPRCAIFQGCHLLNCDRCQLVLLPFRLNAYMEVKFGQRGFRVWFAFPVLFCTRDLYLREYIRLSFAVNHAIEIISKLQHWLFSFCKSMIVGVKEIRYTVWLDSRYYFLYEGTICLIIYETYRSSLRIECLESVSCEISKQRLLSYRKSS